MAAVDGDRVSRDGPARKSRDAAARSGMDEPESEAGAAENGEEEATCCHRVTVCHPVIRDAIVTEPLSRWLGERLTWEKVFHATTSLGLVSMGWAVLYFLLGDTMLPRNDGFGLLAIAVLASVLGSGLASVPYLNLPPVFGMLIAGLIVRNSGLYRVREELGSATASKIRTFCLTFVMIRAGLQLSITSLKRHPLFLMLLALLPSSVELLVLALSCRCVLSYPWDWSFMAGAVLGCMSPVVTVNCVLALLEQGYGHEKGLATILCTAACIDDVHVVSVFSVCYSIVFADGDADKEKWWEYVPLGVRDACLALLFGCLLGIWLVFFPHRSHEYAQWYRMACLVFGSLMCTTATANLTVSAGGYLASLVMSFVAATGWKVLSAQFDTGPFRRAAYVLWQLVQPVLVGIIGADIELAEWSPSRFLLHLLCILLGLTARSVTALLLTLRTTFTWKERLFLVICWIPKGTLQAGLGPMAYERLQNGGDREHVRLALDLVRVSVLTILFLAPIGASLIAMTGPLLLEKASKEQLQRDRELSYVQLLSLLPSPSK